MRKLVIDIYRLSNQLHQYEFEVGETFFHDLKQDLVTSGKLKASIALEKNDSHIGMKLSINGSVDLICDRSLESFQYPINEDHKVIFKYGDQEQELDHDVVMITHSTQQIDVGQYIFEFVGLAIPIKKLHPRFEDSEDEAVSLVYSSEDTDEQQEITEPDPRWKKLNDLKRIKKL